MYENCYVSFYNNVDHFYFDVQTVYSGVTYAGYVGLITGMKPTGFSMTLDERGMSCQHILFVKWSRVGCRVF